MDSFESMALVLHDIAMSLWAHKTEVSSAVLSGLAAYKISLYFMQPVRLKLLQRNISGIDINKTTPQQRRELTAKRQDDLDEDEKRLVVPESLGIFAGAVYLGVLITTMLLVFGKFSQQLDGAVTTISIMLLLGFVDDVLDMRWRYKILFSAIGSLPLIMTYNGSLSVSVPWPLQPYFHASMIYLGRYYLIYLSFLCIFCTNSINILAGVNGVEVGQSIVIALMSILYNIVQLRLEEKPDRNDGDGVIQQLMAILMLAPFVGVSMALWQYNRYPARIFVGDSYTYFAGTVLSVAGMTGLYGKTLMLFFIPQIINFVLSLPQLFHIIPCPRHRVPRWDARRNVLQNSGNYTLLNVILWFCGDMREDVLTMAVIKLQLLFSAFGFVVRFLFASCLYENVN